MQLAIVALPSEKFILVVGGVSHLVDADQQGVQDTGILADKLAKETGACSVVFTAEDVEVLPGKYKLRPAYERKIIRLAEAQMKASLQAKQ